VAAKQATETNSPQKKPKEKREQGGSAPLVERACQLPRQGPPGEPRKGVEKGPILILDEEGSSGAGGGVEVENIGKKGNKPEDVHIGDWSWVPTEKVGKA